MLKNLWWFGIRCNLIEKLLCWLGLHNWTFHYIFDKKDQLAKYGHFHIVGGSRICQQSKCKVRQLMKREIPSENKIRWEK